MAAASQGFDEAHGLPHSLRVACTSLQLAKMEGYERRDLVVAAALLHDIGRGVEDEAGAHHAWLAAMLAEQLLSPYMDADDIEAVAAAVLEHSYSYAKREATRPSSILSCIISDADKLDAIGAVGVARAILHGHMKGRSLADTVVHYRDKLARLDRHLCLDSSRRMAEERLGLLHRFFEELEKELAAVEVDAKALLRAVTRRLGENLRP